MSDSGLLYFPSSVFSMISCWLDIPLFEVEDM